MNLKQEMDGLAISKIKKYREYIFLYLYQTEMLGRRYFDLVTFNQFAEQNEVPSDMIPMLESWSSQLMDILQDIDSKIGSVAVDWKLDRIGKVEISLLRTYIFEILYREHLESAIFINDAVELSKKYGSQKCASFVNAILDAISKKK